MTVKVPESLKYLFEPLGSYRYRAAWGGRGSGKSHGAATALILKAAAMPLTILCCREVQRSIKDSVKRLIDTKIRDLHFEKRFESTLTETRCSNGSVFLYEGLRQNVDNIKSLEGVDIAWVEEAQSVSQNSIDTLIPTIRKPNSEIWFTWNPRFKTDPVDVMFRNDMGPPPRTRIEKVNFDANPFFPQVLREEMEWDKKRNPDKYEHVWLGEYLTHSEARVFRNWTVEPFETPKVDRFYFGADWGFSVDPTVLIRCFIQGRTLFVDYEAYKVGLPIEATPSFFRKVPQALNYPIIADSARPETIAFMRSNGFRNMYAAKKGEGSVEDGVEFLKNYDIVVHPRCVHLVDELSMYSYKIDKLTNEILTVLEDKNNHCIDALRYSIETLRRITGAIITPPIIVTTSRDTFGAVVATKPSLSPPSQEVRA